MEKKYLILGVIAIILIIAVGSFLVFNNSSSSMDEQQAVDIYNQEMRGMLPNNSSKATSAELVDYEGQQAYKINNNDAFKGDAYVLEDGSLQLNGTIN